MSATVPEESELIVYPDGGGVLTSLTNDDAWVVSDLIVAVDQ